jgi:hypothetical protein
MSDDGARPAPAPRRVGDALAVFALALVVRLAVVAWAGARFPPAGDGTYYERIAERIAAGYGYTWLWPDGAVTFAAHYPVGYPAVVGAIYALVGPRPAAAAILNALLGALAALAVHRAVRHATRARAVPLAAGVLVALHPGLVAYTPAIMTEGVTAALVACAVWAASHARAEGARRGRASLAGAALVGLVVGAATLVRPQSIALAPLLGLVAGAVAHEPTVRVTRRVLRALAPAALATGVALAVCAPWTARNCARMHRCALVSVNGGWNLLIGADPASTGAWSPIQVPAACREVWDEAGKDDCFGREARRYIAEHPAAWVRLVPRKLAATFDYCGAAGWYLHEGNAGAFDDAAKVSLGAVETVFSRLALALALVGLGRAPAREGAAGRVVRLALVAAALAFTFGEHGWVGYALAPLIALPRARELAGAPAFELGALAVLAATLATHAVFFGAGRYSLVVFPLVCALAAPALVGLRAALRALFGAGAAAGRAGSPVPATAEPPRL